MLLLDSLWAFGRKTLAAEGASAGCEVDHGRSRSHHAADVTHGFVRRHRLFVAEASVSFLYDLLLYFLALDEGFSLDASSGGGQAVRPRVCLGLDGVELFEDQSVAATCVHRNVLRLL